MLNICSFNILEQTIKSFTNFVCTAHNKLQNCIQNKIFPSHTFVCVGQSRACLIRASVFIWK